MSLSLNLNLIVRFFADFPFGRRSRTLARRVVSSTLAPLVPCRDKNVSFVVRVMEAGEIGKTLISWGRSSPLRAWHRSIIVEGKKIIKSQKRLVGSNTKKT